MTHQSIANKIEKLIAHAESTNHEGEAAAFMAKAHALMEEHSLSLLDLGRLNVDDAVGTERDVITFAGTWQRKVAAALAGYFGCTVVQSSHGRTKHLHFIGRESARTTAKLMIPYVLKQVYALAEDLADKEGMTRSVAGTAVGNALSLRLYKLIAEQKLNPTGGTGINALVPVDLLKAEMNAQFNRITSITSRPMTTNGAAKDAAQRVSLNRQAAHSAPSSRMIA